MIKRVFTFRMLVVFLQGIASGLPLVLVAGSTLQAWMTDLKVDLTLIGIFSLVGLPYTLKFVWAPFMDRYVPRFLGRRRGWMLVTQVLLTMGIATMGLLNPLESLWLIGGLALLIAFFSASQDIVIDAYRREILPDSELGLGMSVAVAGYRIGLLIAGAFGLFLADRIAWSSVYFIMAGSMGIGVLTTLICHEPPKVKPPTSLTEAIVGPFVDFFSRRHAIVLLLFILLYKIGDTMANNMTTPFILSLGFTKTEYATLGKTLGLASIITGGIVGGLMLLKVSLYRALWIFGILQGLSTYVFAILAQAGKSYILLAGTVVFENITSGMGTAAHVALMAGLCNRRFTGTQYALLSSLIGIPRTLLNAPTGYMAKTMGWEFFFTFCALIAIPGLWLLTTLKRPLGLGIYQAEADDGPRQ